MIGYYFRLALASFRRTPGITLLMVLAVTVGIGVCVVTLTLTHAISGNPIWWKSDQLYAVTLDNWNPAEPADNTRPSLPPDQLTYRDAEFVYHSDIPKRTAIMYRAEGIVSGDGLNGPSSRCMPIRASRPGVSFRCSTCHSIMARGGPRKPTTPRSPSSSSRTR